MILADEPTGALDSANAAHVLEIFKGLESPERAVVMVTHDPTVANTARRKVSMRDGQIVADEHASAAESREPVPRSARAWPGPGLTARKVRTLLIMLGPIVGVAAMVGAVGLTESAKGDLKEKLGKLGTNLIIAQAGGTFGSQNPTFPDDAVHRVEALSTVTERRRDDEPVERDRGPDRGRQRLLPGVPGAGARRRPRPARRCSRCR